MPDNDTEIPRRFSCAELLAFMDKQPDDRIVRFGENHLSETNQCGCMLIHFGKEELKLEGHLSASYSTINVLKAPHSTELLHRINGDHLVEAVIFRLVQELPNNYGRAKLLIRSLRVANGL